MLHVSGVPSVTAPFPLFSRLPTGGHDSLPGDGLLVTERDARKGPDCGCHTRRPSRVTWLEFGTFLLPVPGARPVAPMWCIGGSAPRTSAPTRPPTDDTCGVPYLRSRHGREGWRRSGTIVLFTDFSSDVEIYTPAGTYQSAWAPTIKHVAATLTHGSRSNLIAGTQFNGLSQGAAYGDDTQNATNFPVVRITNNATGDVFYANTHNSSTMGVATGNTLVSAKFDVPANIETGASSLVVVANGIPSAAVTVTIN